MSFSKSSRSSCVALTSSSSLSRSEINPSTSVPETLTVTLAVPVESELLLLVPVTTNVCDPIWLADGVQLIAPELIVNPETPETVNVTVSPSLSVPVAVQLYAVPTVAVVAQSVVTVGAAAKTIVNANKNTTIMLVNNFFIVPNPHKYSYIWPKGWETTTIFKAFGCNH